MQLTNNAKRYGLISRLFHWLMALLLIGLFLLGDYMTGIDYYNPWYKDSFALHKSFGLLVPLLLIARLAWLHVSSAPPLTPTEHRWEQTAATLAHRALYLLMLALPVSGYLISTADGHGIAFFGLFEIPALYTPSGDGEQMEEIAGQVHELLAWGGALLVLVHAGAAIKHHLIDRDDTLSKMAGRLNADPDRS